MRPRAVLADADWPSADRAAWAAALEPPTILDDGGRAGRWSQASREAARWGYARWLFYLSQTEPTLLDIPFAARITPELVRRYLVESCAEISSVSRWNYCHALYSAARVMAHELDWAWLKALVARLAREAVPRDKRARMVDPLRLIELGIRLMDTAPDAPIPPHYGRENQFRDGLLIALLALRPIRRRNIACLYVGKQLLRVGECYKLVFTEAETKNRRLYEVQVPALLVPYLEQYLTKVRPRFPRAGEHDGLWASEKGCPMSEEAIYDRVRRRTKQALGVAVNLHSIRDSAVTFLADQDEEGINNARDLLGHARLSTTERHYLHADRRKAVQAFQNSVEQLRQQYRQRPKGLRPLVGTNT